MLRFLLVTLRFGGTVHRKVYTSRFTALDLLSALSGARSSACTL